MPKEAPKAQPRTPTRGMPAPAPDLPRVSRIERMRVDGIEPQLPELSGGEHLVGYLMEAGPVSAAGFGVAALTWTELQAWQQQIGVELQPWEARTLRRLSADFAAESRRAEAHDALAPLAIEQTERNRAAVARKIGIEFGAMAAAQRGRARQ